MMRFAESNRGASRIRNLWGGACAVLLVIVACLAGPGRALAGDPEDPSTRLGPRADLPPVSWGSEGAYDVLPAPEPRVLPVRRIGGGTPPVPSPPSTGGKASVPAGYRDPAHPDPFEPAGDCRLWRVRCGAISSHATGLPPPSAAI